MTRSTNLAIDAEPLPYAYYENPYPFYDQLRSEDPVHWSDSWNCWMVTRYTDAANVLRDQWVDVINGFLGSRRPDPGEGREAQANLLELLDTFRQLVLKRRAHPQDDLVSRLAAAEDGGDRFTEAEVLATCQTLLTAGYETTV